jgi:hypothetical protein
MPGPVLHRYNDSLPARGPDHIPISTGQDRVITRGRIAIENQNVIPSQFPAGMIETFYIDVEDPAPLAREGIPNRRQMIDVIISACKEIESHSSRQTPRSK